MVTPRDHLNLDVRLRRDLVSVATSTEGVTLARGLGPDLALVLVLPPVPFTRGMMADFIVAEIDSRRGIVTRRVSTNTHEIAGLTNTSE
jgi:hypothetical protein